MDKNVFRIGTIIRLWIIYIAISGSNLKDYGSIYSSIDSGGIFLIKNLLFGGEGAVNTINPIIVFYHAPAIMLGLFLEKFGFNLTILITFFMLTTLLASELIIFRILEKNSINQINLSYLYLNPLLIYFNYFLEINSVLISLSLTVAGFHLIRGRSILSGIFFGLAIGIEPIFLLVLPAMLVFRFDNPRNHKNIKNFLISSTLCSLLMHSPTIFSFFTLNSNAGEILQSFAALTLTSLDSEYSMLFLVLYCLFLTWLFIAGRTTICAFFCSLGIGISIIAILIPKFSGLFLVGHFLFVGLSKIANRRALIILTVVDFCYLIQSIATQKIAFIEKFKPDLLNVFQYPELYWVAVFCSMVLLVYLLLEAKSVGDSYGFGESPKVISIAGNSGVGKDTVSTIIRNAFGRTYVTELCGDNYHLFERSSEAWKHTTHLNPDANNLLLWKTDLLLTRKRRHFMRSVYDHLTGKFTSPRSFSKADLVISQGLHALYPEFEGLSDLKIYLSMEDELRREFKIARDTTYRGKSRVDVINSLNRRAEDSKKHIDIQSENADIRLHFWRERDDGKALRITVSSVIPNYLSWLEFVLQDHPAYFSSSSNVSGILETISFDPDKFDSPETVQILKNEMKNYYELLGDNGTILDGYNSCIVFLLFSALDRRI